jgi:hypothetical protein
VLKLKKFRHLVLFLLEHYLNLFFIAVH